MYKIAITGKANTGKNTLATILYNQISKSMYFEHRAKTNSKKFVTSCKMMAFADPIKKIVEIMFPQCNRECLYGSSQLRSEIIPGAFKDSKPLTYRQALIDIGTEVGRSYNDKIWLENFDSQYEKEILQEYPPDVIIVTDVRFRNEFEHLKKKGFFQIRLYRDTGQAPINHISETNQSSILDEEFNYVLFNNKSLDDMEEEIKTKIVPRLSV